MSVAVRTEAGVTERGRVCLGRSGQAREMKRWPAVEFKISKLESEEE